MAGGFAFTTLRSTIIYLLEPGNRTRFKDITVIYGARSPGMLLYKDELAAWEARDDIKMHITVDGTDDPDWKYNVGFVPAITEKKAPGAKDAYRLGLRPAHYDQVHPTGAGKTGFSRGTDYHEPGKPDEVRHRHVRPLQRRPGIRLQGRAGLHAGQIE